MNKSLLLSLGHNSSAILVIDDKIYAGYEEERLSKNKSDSKFPIKAIMKLHNKYNLKTDTDVYISHWFLDGLLPEADKYYDSKIVSRLYGDGNVFHVDEGFTHHDSHAYSALMFAGEEFPEPYHVMVVDGFGTSGECISVYKKKDGESLTKIFKVSGFSHSVGLLYQYATAFCGMTMHQHEYKMLAYETHITEILNDRKLVVLDQDIDRFVGEMVGFMMVNKYELNLSDLSTVRYEVNRMLDELIRSNYDIEKTERNIRILVSYFTQRVTEGVVMRIRHMFQITNLIVAGGVFYNVKLNHMLCDSIDGKFCAMPLAGDQGAALGLYKYLNPKLKWPHHLFWGERRLNEVSSTPGIWHSYYAEDTLHLVQTYLRNDGRVNLVRGAMEFGPRALCNTSTLALPTKANVDIINEINGRTNEMPFALVMTYDQAHELFVDVDKVHKSLEYMIITRKFKPGAQVGLEGGAHYYPLTDTYTCRPQITQDPMLIELLEEFGPLINTSFNIHGNPIVYDDLDVDINHIYQNGRHQIATIKEGE